MTDTLPQDPPGGESSAVEGSTALREEATPEPPVEPGAAEPTQDVDATEIIEACVIPTAPAPEESRAPVPPIADYREDFQGVRDELAALRGLFETKLLRDRSQQQVIDKLHASLKEAEADLVWNIRRPILAEIVQMHDYLSDALAKADSPAVLQRFLEDLEDLLLRLGVEPYRTSGDQFDARTQSLKRGVPAVSPAQVGTIAERIRPGFKSDRHTLRPEAVAVYVRSPQTTSKGGEIT